MELYPSDLGRTRYLALLRRRAWAGVKNGGAGNGTGMAAAGAITLATDEIKPSKHPFASYWTEDLKVRDGETRSKAASVAQSGGNGIGMTLTSIFSGTHLTLPLSAVAAYQGHPEIAVLLGLAWMGGVYSLWRFAPRQWLQKMDRQVLSASELESLLPTARGNLERQYLSLAMDITRATIPTETARSEIRASFAALGEAVTALPGDPPTHGPTAVVYKNALLQLSHLRDVIATFDNGVSAVFSAGQMEEATNSIDRLNVEAGAMAKARQELEDELGTTLLAGISGSTKAATALPQTVTPTPAAPPPLQQMVGQGSSTAATSGTTSNNKWWQQKSG